MRAETSKPEVSGRSEQNQDETAQNSSGAATGTDVSLAVRTARGERDEHELFCASAATFCEQRCKSVPRARRALHVSQRHQKPPHRSRSRSHSSRSVMNEQAGFQKRKGATKRNFDLEIRVRPWHREHQLARELKRQVRVAHGLEWLFGPVLSRVCGPSVGQGSTWAQNDHKSDQHLTLGVYMCGWTHGGARVTVCARACASVCACHGVGGSLVRVGDWRARAEVRKR